MSAERGRRAAPVETSGGGGSIYGYVVALRDEYGFIQPVKGGEHVYFDRKDGQIDTKVGDDVTYFQRSGKRGAFAVQIQTIDMSQVQKVSGLAGEVVGEYENHRNTPGVITSEALLNAIQTSTVPFKLSPAEVNRRGPRLVKGDEVSFELHYIPNTGYAMALEVKLAMSKKEKRRQQLVQELLAKGAVVEQGIVDNVVSDYGFISPMEHADQIFFRLDDIVGDTVTAADVRKGLEVEYIVITETVRGKESARAVHLRALPKGSVKFEVTLAEQVAGLVVQEPKSFPSEVPGKCLLTLPCVDNSGNQVTEVELWARCLPDNMLCKNGDTVLLDVVFYKREKLIFARSVRMLQYEPLSREYGTIVRIRDGEPYGFLHSDMREADIYFRLKDVTVGSDGRGCEPASAADLKVGALLSFNILLDESHGAAKLKSVRLHIAQEVSEISASSRRILLKEAVEGVVTREAIKEQAGQLRLNKSLGIPESELLTIAHGDVIKGVAAFVANANMRELTLDSLITCQRKALYEVLPLFTGVAYDLLEVTTAQAGVTGNLRSVRLYKLGAAEYAEWSKGVKKEQPAYGAADEEAREMVSFHKNDTDDSCGALIKEYPLTCDVYYDRRTGKLIARNVIAKEVIPEDGAGVQQGVVATVKSKNNSRFGVIRLYPTNEKLFWHSSCVSRGVELAERDVVSFLIRIRGGIRSAVDVTRISTEGLLNDEVAVEGRVQAIVLDNGKAIVVDASECPVLKGVYIDLSKAAEAVASKSDAESWNKHTRPAAGQKQESGGEVKETSDASPKPDDSAPKYFTPCERVPLSVEQSDTTLSPGLVVWCSPIMKWATSITPISLRVLEVTGSVAHRYLGTVNRVKIKAMGVSLMEIRKDSRCENSTISTGGDMQPGVDGPIICFAEELVSRHRALHVGDSVDFMSLPNTNLAFNVLDNRPPQGTDDGGIVFKRGPKIDTKNAALKAASTVIIMAAGPPEDSSKGFAIGWRDLPSIGELPWNHLLAHLG